MEGVAHYSTTNILTVNKTKFLFNCKSDSLQWMKSIVFTLKILDCIFIFILSRSHFINVKTNNIMFVWNILFRRHKLQKVWIGYYQEKLQIKNWCHVNRCNVEGRPLGSHQHVKPIHNLHNEALIFSRALEVTACLCCCFLSVSLQLQQQHQGNLSLE